MSGFVLLGVLFFAAGILAFAFKYYDNLEKRYKNSLSLVLCCCGLENKRIFTHSRSSKKRLAKHPSKDFIYIFGIVRIVKTRSNLIFIKLSTQIFVPKQVL